MSFKRGDMMSGINVITGGRGHVGFALVKELADRGEKIRLLLRSDSSAFDGIECEKVKGDVTDPESLAKAFEGAETVYHVAGVVDISGKKDKQVWAVNVEGTKNVVAACKNAGVKNLIFVSSVDAIPVDDKAEKITEISHFDPDVLEGTYAKSKAVSTQYVLDSADENLKVCAIHPSCCIGPYDNNGTSSICTMMKLFDKGFFPITFDFGGYNFVDVRDVAKGMIGAAEKGRNGECYILCGNAYTLDEFIGALAEACGRKKPKIVIKHKTVMKLIPFCEKLFDKLKLPPVINEYSIRKICENCKFSHEKATEELGYTSRPLVDSLRDAIEWMKEDEAKKKAAAKNKK